MIRKIRKKHLIALFTLVAMITGIATSVIMMSSDSNDNTANATDYTAIVSSGGGLGGFSGPVRYKIGYGNSRGGNDSDADRIITRLIESKGNNFQCQEGVVWYAYFTSNGQPVVLTLVVMRSLTRACPATGPAAMVAVIHGGMIIIRIIFRLISEEAIMAGLPVADLNQLIPMDGMTQQKWLTILLLKAL